jgi:integrase
LSQTSPHTSRTYSVRTINHRVRGVLRFYAWAVRRRWLASSPLVSQARDFHVARRSGPSRVVQGGDPDAHLFVLRQFSSLPRPLTAAQSRELLAVLTPPYDLMARWQLYTGLRVSELLRLTVQDISSSKAGLRTASSLSHRTIDVMRKGRKPGHVIASASLLEETAAYLATHRRAWLARVARRRASSRMCSRARGRFLLQLIAGRDRWRNLQARAGLSRPSSSVGRAGPCRSRRRGTGSPLGSAPRAFRALRAMVAHQRTQPGGQRVAG